MKFLLWLALLACALAYASGYHILMMLTFASKSHKIAFDPVAEALVKKGHQVTIMSPIETSQDTPGITNIFLHEIAAAIERRNMTFFQSQAGADIFFLEKIFGSGRQLCNLTYNHEPELVKLVKDPRGQNYDVLIIDAVMNEWLLALGPHLGIPTILLSPAQKLMTTAWSMNIPAPYSYVPNGIEAMAGDLTYRQRVSNIMTNLVFIFARDYYLFKECDHTIQNVIPDSLPLTELEKRVSFLLTNSHPALHPSVPSMPYTHEVGCLHCKKAKPLPKDLEDFMQSSGKDGVIYFSLGSATKGSSMPLDMRDKIVEVFGQLPQKILWKYENEIENLPKNIRLTKWAPQQDILAHPKIRLFITHGGGMSTFETAYHGCPILGFPLSADQWGNMANAVHRGIAESLDWRTFTAEEFLRKINLMLTDSRYQQNVDRISALLKDRLLDPPETAVYWIEYVIRHQGAPHLRSAADQLNFFQYFLLDVICLIAAMLLALAALAYFILRKICRRFCPCRTEKGKTMSKTQKRKQKTKTN